MKNLTIFITGAFGYGIIENLWRGYTHWTMGILGGICLMILYNANKALKDYSYLGKSIRFTLIITFLELITGIIVNIILKMNVWDYSNQPLNIYRQICPVYSLFWFVLSYPIIFICNKIEHILKTPAL